MYSVHEIRRELRQILQEYRSGAREPTVVSEAIFSDNHAEKRTRSTELTQQIHTDLEDKDIHPKSISLNDSFIQQWLESTLAAGGLEESSDAVEGASQPNFERLSDQAHHDERPTAVGDAVSPDRSTNGVPASHIQERNAEERPTTPPDYLDEVKTLGIDDMSRPPSRTESISSHRSKPDDWRPYDTPNPAWVRDMLLPLFNRDPFLDSADTDQDLRIKRAFHQQDYDRRGAIADHKVLRLCADLASALNLPALLNNLRTTVYSVDIDGNGQFDEAEYMTLVKILITTVMDLKKDTIRETLLVHGHEAAEAAQKKRLSKGSDYLLWGWARTPEGSEHLYEDTIAGSYEDTAPTLPELSFTSIIEDARIAVEMIDGFEERWLKMVPKERQRREAFQAPLEIARELAYRFKAFENPQDRRQTSDLDAIFFYYKLVSTSDAGVQEFPFNVVELRKVFVHALLVICMTQGFVFILENISRELGSHVEAHYYTKLNEKLDGYQVTQLAKQLALQTAAWNEHVTYKIENYRRADMQSSLFSLQRNCEVLASRYHNRLKHAKEEAKNGMSKWAVLFQRVEITNWKISRGRKLLGTASPPSKYEYG
ncbi:hypothetical protein P171DRAFT_183392 [Karstenula rhodostoma CBS 690.94]|uniref:EF-hand domain-containing protein n=1 Tax=Karstenula rhodostoma CBS 690.94 TaxID=1392251 RepID=A0A9P4U5Y9_9PLEO|nr:hypothetical protein P171DRAFT_183392 [Karstenula rhodostoma CBS 690.94]